MSPSRHLPRAKFFALAAAVLALAAISHLLQRAEPQENHSAQSVSRSTPHAPTITRAPSSSRQQTPTWRQMVLEERWDDLDVYLRSLAQSDPHSAALITANCGTADPERNARLVDIFSAWLISDPEAAAHWLTTVEDSRLQSLLYPRFAQSADPSTAADVIPHFPESVATSRAAAITADRLAALDPRAASQWASHLPHASSRQAAAKAVAARWIIEDPHATAEWIQQLPNERSRSSTQSLFAREMLKLDTYTALAWALEIQSPGLRDREILHIGSQSIAEDPVLTRHLFQHLSIDPDLSRSIEP
jgi:hypothetical protein